MDPQHWFLEICPSRNYYFWRELQNPNSTFPFISSAVSVQHPYLEIRQSANTGKTSDPSDPTHMLAQGRKPRRWDNSGRGIFISYFSSKVEQIWIPRLCRPKEHRTEKHVSIMQV
jgi:hypothetical protein